MGGGGQEDAPSARETQALQCNDAMQAFIALAVLQVCCIRDTVQVGGVVWVGGACNGRGRLGDCCDFGFRRFLPPCGEAFFSLYIRVPLYAPSPACPYA